MKYIGSDVLDGVNAVLTSIDGPAMHVYGRMELYGGQSMGSDGKKLYRRLEQEQKSTAEALQNALRQPHLSSSLSESEMVHSPFGIPQTVQWDARHLLSAALLAEHPDTADQLARKTLVNLITCLNSAFPDYDFSLIKPAHFVRHRFRDVMERIKSLLLPLNHSPGATSIPVRISKALAQVLGSADDKQPPSSGSEHDQNWYMDVDVFEYRPDDGLGDPYDDDDSVIGELPQQEEDGSPVPVATESKIWSMHFFFYHRRLKRLVLLTMCCKGKNVEFDDDFPTGAGSAEELILAGDENSASSDAMLNLPPVPPRARVISTMSTGSLEGDARLKLPPQRLPADAPDTSSGTKRKREESTQIAVEFKV